MLNTVKKNFMRQIKEQYEEILMGVFNICVKFVNNLRKSNKRLREDF